MQENNKRRHRYRRLLLHSFKYTGASKILGGYLIFFFLVAAVITLLEPGIANYGDGLWFTFAVSTTVGFGDVTAVTLVGRILTVILSIYSLGIVAIFTAVITSFFMNIAKAQASESAAEFVDDLMHLTELSKEELQAVSDKVKAFVDGK